MKAHLRYLRYVVRHRWFVFVEACRLGIPWRGLMHDLSKFSATEWFPYVRHFYGPEPSPRDATGAYDPASVGADFDLAWLHHQHHSPHHWQYWILRGDVDSERALPMPDVYIREMVADWRGAGRAMGKPGVLEWYERNRDKMVLHPNTRRRVEELLLWTTP